MLKRVYRELLFFAIIFSLLILTIRFLQYWNSRTDTTQIHLLVVSLIATLIVSGMYYLADLHKCGENFWDVTPSALCKGGSYLYQGDSETARMCRDLAKTQEGKCAIASYNCPKGYIGQPKLSWYDPPLSDDNWRNEKCSSSVPNCGCVQVGNDPDNLTAFERVTPYDTDDNQN